MTIKDAFPVPDVKDALDNGPVQTREMGVHTQPEICPQAASTRR